MTRRFAAHWALVPKVAARPHCDERHADAQVHRPPLPASCSSTTPKRRGVVPDELAEELVLADLAAATD